MKYTQTLSKALYACWLMKTQSQKLLLFSIFLFCYYGSFAQCPGAYDNVVINEVSGDSGQSDGCNDGILELAGPAGADIGCMVVSNGEWAVVLPTGTTVPADGTFLIACSEDPTGGCGVGLTGSTNGLTCDECDFPGLAIDFDVCLPANAANYDPGATGFTIDNSNGSDGDQVVLFQPDGTVHDAVKWGAATATSGAGTTFGGASGDADNVAVSTIGYTLGTAGIRGDGGLATGVPVVPLGTCATGSTYMMPPTSDTVYVDLSPTFKGCNSSYSRVASGCMGANGSPTHLDNTTCPAIPTAQLVPSACASGTAALQWGYTDHPTPGLANDSQAWDFSVDNMSICGTSGVFTFTLEVYNWQSVSGDDPPVPGGNAIDAGSGSLDEQIGSYVIGPAIDGNLVDDPTGFPVSIWTTYDRDNTTGITTLTYTTAALPPGSYDYTLQWDDFTNCCGSVSETSGNECYERMDFTVEVVESIVGATIDPCTGDGTVSVSTTEGTGITYTLLQDGLEVNVNSTGIFSGIIDDSDPDPLYSIRLSNACSTVTLPVPTTCFGTPPCPTLSYSCVLPEGDLCPGDAVDMTITGQNIPAGTNLNFYYDNNAAFDPYDGGGTLLTSVTTPVATSIMINEVLFDPRTGGQDGTSNNDEWIEIFGPAGTDVGCYVVSDGDFAVVIPAGTNIPASGFLTIGNTGSGGPEGLCGDEVPTIDVFTCGCISGTSFILSNGSEQVAIFDDNGTFLDGISWGGGDASITSSVAFSAIGSCMADSVDLSSGTFENIGDNDGGGSSIGRFPDGSANLMAFSDDSDCDDGNLPKSFNAPNNLVTSYTFGDDFCNIGTINIIGVIEGLDLNNCDAVCTNNTADGCDVVCDAPVAINISCPTAELVPVVADQCVGDGPVMITVNLSGLTADNYCIVYAINGTNQPAISVPATATSTMITIPDADTGGESKVSLVSVAQSDDCSMPASGCSGIVNTEEACINIHPIPTASITSSANITACDGSGDGTIEVTIVGTGPFDFEYKINNGSPILVAGVSSPYTISTSIAGTYSLCSVSDEAGCTGTVNGSVPILAPVAATTVIVAPDPLTICDNGMIEVDLTTDFTYTPVYDSTNFTFYSVNPLSGGFNAALHTLTNTTLTPSAAVTYYVEYTDPTTGCTSVAPLNIALDNAACPSFVCPLISSFLDPGDICVGDSFDLTASGLFNMPGIVNGETDFGISFLSFTGGLPQPTDPYTGGTILANVLFGDLVGFDLTRSGTATGLGGALIPGTYTICVILNPAPTDPDCRPSTCFELVVNPRPAVPTDPVDVSYCGRSRPPGLSVALPPTGTTITWWTAATGGSMVTGAALSPTGNIITLRPTSNPAAPAEGSSLTIYAESTDPTTMCGSTTRVPVTITHFANPIVTFTAPDDLCANDGLQTNLTGGMPTGGTYVGPGVTDGGDGMTYSFDPAIATVGVQTITYNYTDDNGCSASASDMVEVLAFPGAPLADDIMVCEGGSTEITATAPVSQLMLPMTLLSEFFETDGNGTRYNTSVIEFTDTFNDFFTRTNGSNLDMDYMVSGQQGSFYFAAQDLNGEGGPAQVTLTFTGVDISGKTGLNLEVLLAEDDADDGAEDWDDTASDNNFFHIDYQIDGGGYQNLLHVEGNNAGGSNGAPSIDTDFDGVGDGTVLTDVFQSFNTPISASGNTLDLRITINLEDGDEDIAFDNIVLEGLDEDGTMFKYYDADPAGGMATLLAGPTVLPYDPGTTSANSPQTIYVTICAENGCESSAEPVVVTVFPLPSIDAVVTDVTGCPSDASGAIDLTVMGNGAFTYLWSTMDGSGLVPTDQNQTDLTAGTYMVTVTDANDCVNTFTATVADAIDITPPSIDCPANVEVNCNESTLPTNTGTATSVDDCSPVVILSYTDSLTLDGCGGLTGTLSRTWTSTDAFGNNISCVQLISIVDDINPTFTVPADLTIQCDDNPDSLALTGNPTNLMDNCGTHPWTQIWVNEFHYDNTGGDVGEFIEIAGTADFNLAGYNLYVYNGSSTTMNVSATFPVTGTIPDEGNGFGAVSIPTPGLMNGSPDGFALVDPAGIVLYFYSYEGTFTAASGPAQGITSIDVGVSEPGSTPVGQSLQLSGTGISGPDFTWIGPSTESPGMLNAGQTLTALTFAAPTASYSDNFVLDDPDCPSGGTITRTWTVTDACGNDSMQVQTITVVDTEMPMIVCPADLTIECDADESPANTGMATATDNCDAAPVVTFSDVETPGACAQEKTITRTWLATDNCGNTMECVQTISVEDTTPPDVPAITLVVDIQCANEIPDPVALTTTDNCSPDITASPVDVFVPGDCPSRFSLLRTWTFVDECNNMSSVTQTINVLDDEPLQLLACAPDQIIECASDAMAQPYLIDVLTPCGSDFTVESIGPEVVGTINCPGTNYVYTYIATDDCGRTVSCQQTYTIENDGPQFVCPPDICVIDCPADYAMMQATFDAYASVATVLTSCNDIEPTITNNFSPTNFINTNCNSGALAYPNVIQYQTVTFTATDDCGRSTTCSALVVVTDNNGPVIEGEPFLTIRECDDNVQQEYDEWIAANLALMTATDGCSEVEWSHSPASPNEGPWVNGYAITHVIFTATDECGNTATKDVHFKLKNNFPPTFIGNLVDKTVDCADPLPDFDVPTFIHSCGTTTLTSEDATIPGACANEFTIVRTWTVTDNCEGVNTTSQSITVTDNMAPVVPMFVPTDLTLTCATEVPDPISLTAVDACSGDITVMPEDNVTMGSCANDFTIVRTWTFDDGCGNVSSVAQTIVVNDDTAPIFSNVPTGGAAQCQGAVTFDSEPTATDNCGGMVDITFEDIATGDDCSGSITRTWTAIDDCGNIATASATISYSDTEAPVAANVPADATIDCSMSVVFGPAPTWTDNCDTSIFVSFEDITTPGSCANEMSVTRFWSAIDDCSNLAVVSQTINVVDNEAPTFTFVPDGGTFECGNNPNFGMPTATDNCGGMVDITFEDIDNGNGPCNSETTRTWTATDACGNTATVSRTIMIMDSEAPVFTFVPDGGTFDCGTSFGTPTASDNCGMVDITFEDVVNGTACNGSTTRTWTATDACNNIAMVSRTITITDTEAPVFTFVPETPDVDCDNIPDWELPVAEDNCGEVTLTFEESISGDLCDDGYAWKRLWTATDACDNTAQVETVIWVNPDIDGPVFSFVPEGALINCDEFPPTFGEPIVGDACGDITLTFITEYVTGDSTSCDNGENFDYRRVWTATDACGNETTAKQTFWVKASEAALAIVSGHIQDESNEMVEQVEVTVEGPGSTNMMTENDGYFEFPLSVGFNYMLTPYRNDDPLNGVSTYDLILMSKHILGIELLDSPYKMIAADINNSGQITGFDLVELRKMILFINTEFQGNTSWRFVEADYIFPNPTNPFATTFPEDHSINGLLGDEVVDFMAIKTGDVNGSAVANQLSGGDTRNAEGSLIFNLASQKLIAGEEVSIDFTAENFEQLLGYQFTMQLNSALVEFIDIESGQLPELTSDNFGFAKLSEGIITTSWNSNKAHSLEKDAIVFSLKLKAKANVELEKVLTISQSYTPAEAYDNAAALLDLNLAFTKEDGATTVGAFALMQNRPNPYKHSTLVGFNLPAASFATLTIYDVSGRVLKTIAQPYPAGYHELTIDRSELNASGVLYYQLKTDQHSATRKMILMP